MKTKNSTSASSIFSPVSGGGLSLWDEAHVQQENWGGALGLPARGVDSAVALRNTEGKIVVTPDEAQHLAFKESITYVSMCAKGCITSEVKVGWKRAVDILSPFRPMVHRNTTPFLNPYDTERKVFDGKAEEAAMKLVPQPTSKKVDVKSVTAPVPLHIQFPEIVDVLDLQAPESVTAKWKNISDAIVVEQYRGLQPFTGAYDIKLEHGCAATVADVCAMQYSTAQRHRITEVESISKLSEQPPFVMDAFNSAIKFIEYAQTLIKPGDYLWELVHPHAPGTHQPVYNPYGKYAVRLFVNGAFRRVTIDDYMPVDALGRSFLPFTSKGEIWPALLAKAIFVALGTSSHFLFTDPEVIVSFLLGEWIPQRIDPSLHSTDVCGLLLELRTDPSNEVISLNSCGENESPTIASLSSPRENRADKNEEVVKEEKELCANTSDVCDVDALVPKGGLRESQGKTVICAVGFTACGHRKLFVIHDVVLFRNTIALRISTTPPSNIITAKELAPTNTDEDVQEFFRASSCDVSAQRKHDVLKNQSSFMAPFWVTLEEFSSHLHLLVWRHFGDGSPFQFSSRIFLESVQPSSTAIRKKALSFSNSMGRSVVRWVHITSDKPENIALVSLPYFSLASPSSTGMEVGAKIPLLLQSLNLSSNVCSSASFSNPQTPCVEVHLDLYTWNRGDMLSHMESFSYESGKMQCMTYSIPAGSHIFRVTANVLDNQNTISLLATHDFVIGDEKDAFSSANIFKMSDAGIHNGVERPNEEVIWFKRRITVKESTVVSFVVSTLEPGEDPAAHRDIPPPFVKDPKGVKTRAGGAKAPKEPTEEIPQGGCEFPIVPYCHILLMNLDTGSISTGAVGRLLCQCLEPNQHGFLVLAYVMIDSASVASLVDNTVSFASDAPVAQQENSSVSSAPEEKDASLIEKTYPLCSRGMWKLTISSDQMLDSYKQLMQNFFSFSDKGQLKRGTSSMLFSYICIVTERTDFTLLLDLNGREPIPFHIKVLRTGVDAPPIFVSEMCATHLFIPHVTLELGDKAKNTSYTIEAWLDEAKVQELEERRRLAQEKKFLSMRLEAEVKANEKRERDLEEYRADASAFIDRLGQQTTAEVECAAVSLREVPVINAKKGRINGEKRKPTPSGGLTDRSQIRSICLTPPSNAITGLLDITDATLVVTFDLRIHFSTKVDVKNSTPSKDPLASLRAIWDPQIDNFAHDQAALSTSVQHSSRATGNKWKQKEVVVSPEEQLKADQGRMSRYRFLKNPRNILFPYLLACDEPATLNREPARVGAPKELPSLHPVTVSNMVLVTEVTEETSYLHAPILGESRCCVSPIPLRAVEWSSSFFSLPALARLEMLQVKHQKRLQQHQQQQQRERSPSERASSRSGLVSPLFHQNNLLTDLTDLTTPLHDGLHHLSGSIKVECEVRAEGRRASRAVIRSFWDARQPDVPLLSLLRPREDDAGKRPKGRVKTIK